MVFDPSAKYEAVSLNKVPRSGSDFNSTVFGVPLHFSEDSIAFTVDVKQMFHCFAARKAHRDYLRFLWYEESERLQSDAFGNSPSPGVAVYCMRRSAAEDEREHSTNAKQFVGRHFYVDELAADPTLEEATDVLTRSQKMLAESHLKLNKTASNCCKVMEAFPAHERAKDSKYLHLRLDDFP